MVDDNELLRRYAENASEEAFSALVNRHIDFVFATALRRVGNDRYLADEVTQAVFIALAQKAHSVIGHPFLSGWLHRSTHYAAIHALRSNRRHAKLQTEANVMIDLEPDCSRHLQWDDILPLIDSLLDQLREDDRGAVIQRFFEGRSFAEIGATLRVSEDAARMRVDRALDKLRVSLGRCGVHSSVATLAGALAALPTVAAPAGLAATVSTIALASATPGSVAAGLLTFMSTSKAIITVGGIIVAVATIGFVLEWRANVKQRAEVAALRDDNRRLAALASKTDSQSRPAIAKDKQPSDENSDSSADQYITSPVSTGFKLRPKATIAGKDFTQLALKYPEFIRIERARARRQLEREWLPLLATLELSDSSAKAKAMDILVDRATLELKYREAAAQAGQEINDAALIQLMRDGYQISTRELQKAIGSADLDPLERLASRSEPVGAMVNNEVMSDLGRAGLPIDQQQYEKLTVTFLKHYDSIVKSSALRAGNPILSDEALYQEAGT